MKHSCVTVLVLNCFRLKKGRATFFDPKQSLRVSSMVLIPKVLFNHDLKLFRIELDILYKLEAFLLKNALWKLKHRAFFFFECQVKLQIFKFHEVRLFGEGGQLCSLTLLTWLLSKKTNKLNIFQLSAENAK